MTRGSTQLELYGDPPGHPDLGLFYDHLTALEIGMLTSIEPAGEIHVDSVKTVPTS